jgi:hypothetical protein
MYMRDLGHTRRYMQARIQNAPSRRDRVMGPYLRCTHASYSLKFAPRARSCSMLPTNGRPLGPGGKGRFNSRRNACLGSGLDGSLGMGAALLIRSRGLRGCGQRRQWLIGPTTNASAPCSSSTSSGSSGGVIMRPLCPRRSRRRRQLLEDSRGAAIRSNPWQPCDCEWWIQKSPKGEISIAGWVIVECACVRSMGVESEVQSPR